MRKLIAGLGNPGRQYIWTRHNLGFLLIEALCSRYQLTLHHSHEKQGMVAKGSIEGIECSLLKPMTFMNNSGEALRPVLQAQGLKPEDVLVVCDDMSIGFGKLRLRPSGSAGGHNGLKSIITHLGTDEFARLRMGIGAPENRDETTRHVLSDFTPAEKKILSDFINHALDCVTCWVTEGVQVAMNRFNGCEEQ
ncbi:MAG: aminoacyl-tRNA hydrolase [Candidatus Omnitrophica bacterium]|nr:aminoacyl-tRNA hydrolase [Candidatus Omnitrophota bacterium]